MPRPKRKRRAPQYTFWRGDVLWARFTINNEEYRGSLRTSDEATAGRRAKEWYDRELSKSHFGDARKLYTEAFVEWSEQVASNVGSAKTVKRYASSLKQIEQWLTPLYLDEVTSEVVKAIIEGRRAKGVTNATIRRDLTALSSLLEYHDVEANPTLARRKKVKERRDPIVLPVDPDIERVIARAPGCFATLIHAAWLTGCRQDELAQAKRRGLDHEQRQMTVLGKGNKQRVVALSDAAFDLLRSIPAALGSPWLFWHGAGEPYRNVAARFRVLVKDAAKKAAAERREFRPFRFHDLRHRYAVDYLKAGGNIYDLQSQLGHSNIGTTELYLRHLKPEEAREAKYGSAQMTAQRLVR